MPISVRRRAALTILTILLVLAEAAFVSLARLVWSEHRRGHFTTHEAATFVLLGVSAVAGAVILLLAAAAFARGRPAPARLAFSLAWLRVIAVLVTLVVFAAALGASSVAGMLPTGGALIALFDAALGVYIASAATRSTTA
jgi:hypothetical protein